MFDFILLLNPKLLPKISVFAVNSQYRERKTTVLSDDLRSESVNRYIRTKMFRLILWQNLFLLLNLCG